MTFFKLCTNIFCKTIITQYQIRIPQIIHSEVYANADAGSKELTELNGIDGITMGTFGMSVTYTDADGNEQTAEITATIDDTLTTLDDIANAFNNQVPTELEGKIEAVVENGQFKFKSTGITEMSTVAGTSNFLTETELAVAEAENGVISSKTLDWEGSLSASVNKQLDLTATGYEIYENGSIEVTYSNGDKLRVTQADNSTQMEFQYTTSSGIVMQGKDEINVSEDVATVGTLQIQLAHFNIRMLCLNNFPFKVNQAV